MQQQEEAQMRQRDANLTALAFIGPRKKRKLDSPGSTPSGTEVSVFLFSVIHYHMVLLACYTP